MSKSFDIPNENLLAKYFAGEADKQEVILVERWAQASEENKEQFFLYQMVWLDTGKLSTQPKNKEINVDLAWNKVKVKHQAQRKKNQTKRISLWRAAAVIIILIGVSFVINYYSTKETLTAFTATENVASLTLTDGSELTLQKGSKIEYSSDYNENNREVTLKGEAFFEVAHNPKKPFVIHVGNAMVTVLGTSFNVKMNDSATIVSVLKGKVLFTHLKDSVYLTPGKEAVFNHSNQRINEVKQPVGHHLFWKTKVLHFNGQPLYEVLQTLTAVYGVNFQIQNPEIATCKLNVTFDHEPIEEVIDIVALTLNLDINQTENTYLINGKGCGNN